MAGRQLAAAVTAGPVSVLLAPLLHPASVADVTLPANEVIFAVLQHTLSSVNVIEIVVYK